MNLFRKFYCSVPYMNREDLCGIKIASKQISATNPLFEKQVVRCVSGDTFYRSFASYDFISVTVFAETEDTEIMCRGRVYKISGCNKPVLTLTFCKD